MRRDRDRALLARQARPRIRHRVMAQAAGLAEILVALHQRQAALVIIGTQFVDGAIGGIAAAALSRHRAAVVANEQAADARRDHRRGGKRRLLLQHAIDVDAQTVAIGRRQRIEAPAHGDMLPGAGGHAIGSRFHHAHVAQAVRDDEAQGARAAPHEKKPLVVHLRGVEQLRIARAAAGPGRVGLVPERDGAGAAHAAGHRQPAVNRGDGGGAGIEGEAGGAADAAGSDRLRAPKHRAVAPVTAGI